MTYTQKEQTAAQLADEIIQLINVAYGYKLKFEQALYEDVCDLIRDHLAE